MGSSKSHPEEPQALGVMNGVTFIAREALERRTESLDRQGKIRIQVDELQYAEITDVTEETSIGVGGRKGSVLLFGALWVLAGTILGIAIGFAYSPLLPTSELSKNVLAVLAIFIVGITLIAVGSKRRSKKEGYYQIVSPTIRFEELPGWQIMMDTKSSLLRKKVLENVHVLKGTSSPHADFGPK